MARFLQQNWETLVVPASVLPETFYLLGRELQPRATQALLQSLIARELQIEDLIWEDLVRNQELLTQYRDSGLDFVDALVAAVAERVGRAVRLIAAPVAAPRPQCWAAEAECDRPPVRAGGCVRCATLRDCGMCRCRGSPDV